MLEVEKVIEDLQQILKDYNFNAKGIHHGIKLILEKELWKHRDPAPGLLDSKDYKYFPEFVEDGRPHGLGVDFELVEKNCKGYEDVELLLAEAKNVGKGNKGNNNNVMITKQGNTKEYGLQKLKEKRPDLLEKVIAKELTVNKAMIQAGFRYKKIEIPLVVEKAAQRLVKHFSKENIMQLISYLETLAEIKRI